MSADDPLADLRRRTVLGGIAGLGLLSVPAASATADVDWTGSEHEYEPTVERSRHPGHPRFVEVGETLTNPIFVGEVDGFDQGVYGSRDNLAPGGSPDPDPANYETDDFEWSIRERPADSEAELTFASPSEENDEPRYDEGRDNVAEFEADVPGRYVLELVDDAGETHELTIHVFPESEGPPPRIELEGFFEDAGEGHAEADQFVIESNPQLAPASSATEDDLEVVFLADDRDALETKDVAVHDDGKVATVPTDALEGETARVHAAAYDGDGHSMLDTIELDPASESVHLPNRPPEWVDDSVIYQIFTRSWAGQRYEMDLGVLIDGDDELGARGLDYLEELGIDAVWLTPVVPSVSSFMQRYDAEDFEPPDGRERGHYVGGGPHGYDTTDYFDVAPDLAFGDHDPLESYRRFVEECHERDIRVVFDAVINHAGRFHDLFQDTVAEREGDVHETWWEFPRVLEWNHESAAFDWFDRVEADRIAEDSDVYGDGTVLEPSPRPTGFWDLMVMPNWNYDNLAVREYFLAYVDFWTGEIGVDGLRCDIAWGVPHSFWKEVREVARENDGEVLLFDETIPNEPEYAENEFDLHYDKESFTDAALAIGEGVGDASAFLDAIDGRANDGFPDTALFYNCIENHDERRVLEAALEAYDEDHASRVQRACAAASATLPGVPAIYYGQEREISKYGETRHLGDLDPRDGGDVQPDDMRRAFMNWDEYDEDHLAFYRDLIDAYHDLEILHNEPDLRRDWYDADGSHVLVFGRDAGDLDGVAEPERALVAINFEDEPVEIELRDAVDSYDHFTGENVAVSAGETTVVEVDTLAIFETEDFDPPSETVAIWPDEAGDDHGPGWYEYPESDEFSDGDFDLRGLEVREVAGGYEFALEVGSLENVWGFDGGFSVQFPQLYVRDPGAPDSQASGEATRPGVNVVFEEPYHWELMGTGQWGGWIDPAVGDGGRAVDVSGDPAANEIVFEVPADAFDAPIEDLEVAPLVLGFDGQTGIEGVRPVTADGGDWVFEDTRFGDEADDFRHNVIDAITPAGVDNEAALAYDAEERATVPFTTFEEGQRNLVFRGERAVSIEIGEGTDHGPGNYEYPTTDQIPEGAFDIERVDVYESEEYYTIASHMVDELTNPWDGDEGFSLQHLQVYVRDPDAEGGTLEGREGVNATFEAEYHYWLAANMDWTALESASDVDLGDLEVETYEPENAIVLRFEKTAIDGDLTEMEFAPLILGYDGFGAGGVREVHEEASEWHFGGADNENAPRVIDMATPTGLSREDALAYSEDDLAAIPFRPVVATPREAIVGRDEPPSPDHVQTAQEYWKNEDPVPETGGQTVDHGTFREIATDARGYGARGDRDDRGRRN